jgi:ABC-type molybdenum transport system ATPase subunit/photorepair protein PhrA
MGSSGAGKTSMHSVIFANYPGNSYIYLAKDTTRIGYTTDRS